MYKPRLERTWKILVTEKTGKGKANFNMKFESFHGNEVANNEKLRDEKKNKNSTLWLWNEKSSSAIFVIPGRILFKNQGLKTRSQNTSLGCIGSDVNSEISRAYRENRAKRKFTTIRRQTYCWSWVAKWVRFIFVKEIQIMINGSNDEKTETS